MQEIPEEVRAYLSSDDALMRAQLLQTYPSLQQTLSDPQTRTALLSWLASDEAWQPDATGFVAHALAYLRVGAKQDEAPIVRTFLVHTDAHVRLRAYEFLLSLYFPDRNPEAMFLLLHGMLLDGDDTVRAQAAHYIERANAVGELRGFLESWRKVAPSRGWDGSESFELVERLLER